MKKLEKKILVVLLVVALTAACVSGCGNAYGDSLADYLLPVPEAVYGRRVCRCGEGIIWKIGIRLIPEFSSSILISKRHRCI